MAGDLTVGVWSEIPNEHSPLARPSVFRPSRKNRHERSAKPHNTRPWSVIGWNTMYLV